MTTDQKREVPRHKKARVRVNGQFTPSDDPVRSVDDGTRPGAVAAPRDHPRGGPWRRERRRRRQRARQVRFETRPDTSLAFRFQRQQRQLRGGSRDARARSELESSPFPRIARCLLTCRISPRRTAPPRTRTRWTACSWPGPPRPGDPSTGSRPTRPSPPSPPRSPPLSRSRRRAPLPTWRLAPCPMTSYPRTRPRALPATSPRSRRASRAAR